MTNNPTAGIIIIGNEILSGQTLDINSQSIILELAKKGIVVVEIRTILDYKEAITQSVKKLSSKYDYVFTTGGLGPTHDDITVESIALAFNVPCVCNQQIYQILKHFFEKKGEMLDKHREKMAYVPEGAELIFNDLSMVPSFRLNNVYAMAGIPKIMQAMLKAIMPKLNSGTLIKSKTIKFLKPERIIAEQLTQLQNQYPETTIGSYPFYNENQQGTSLVIRSNNYSELEIVHKKLQDLCNKLQ